MGIRLHNNHFLSVDDIDSLLKTFTTLVETDAVDGVYLFALYWMVLNVHDGVWQLSEEVDVV